MAPRPGPVSDRTCWLKTLYPRRLKPSLVTALAGHEHRAPHVSDVTSSGPVSGKYVPVSTAYDEHRSTNGVRATIPNVVLSSVILEQPHLACFHFHFHCLLWTLLGTNDVRATIFGIIPTLEQPYLTSFPTKTPDVVPYKHTWRKFLFGDLRATTPGMFPPPLHCVLWTLLSTDDVRATIPDIVPCSSHCGHGVRATIPAAVPSSSSLPALWTDPVSDRVFWLKTTVHPRAEQPRHHTGWLCASDALYGYRIHSTSGPGGWQGRAWHPTTIPFDIDSHCLVLLLQRLHRGQAQLAKNNRPPRRPASSETAHVTPYQQHLRTLCVSTTTRRRPIVTTPIPTWF